MHGSVAVERHHRHGPFAERKRGLHRLEDAVRVLRSDHNAVHHSFDVVHFVAVHLEARFQLDQLAVNTGSEVSEAHDLLEEFAVVTLSAAHHGGEQEELLAVEPRQDVLRDLVVRVAHHRLTGLERIRVGGSGVEQAQKVVQLCHGAHSRTRIFRDSLLFDGHHGAQPGNGLDVRPLQATKKLPGVGAERFEKPALSFGVQRVKGQARFPAAADPREDHEFVARQHNADPLKVVFRRACDDEVILALVQTGMRR